jgi:hypothetical protein
MGIGGPTPRVTICMPRESTRVYADKAVNTSSLLHATHCGLYHPRYSLFDPLGPYAVELSSHFLLFHNVPASQCRLRNTIPAMTCRRQSHKWTLQPTSTYFSPIQCITIHKKRLHTAKPDLIPSQDDGSGCDGLS